MTILTPELARRMYGFWCAQRVTRKRKATKRTPLYCALTLPGRPPTRGELAMSRLFPERQHRARDGSRTDRLEG